MRKNSWRLKPPTQPLKKKKKIEAPKELKDKNPESDGGGRTSVKDTNAK